MLLKQLDIHNPGRNFNYLVACSETKEAIAIDPLDAPLCLATAQENGWRITQVVNTHEHWDHIGGNEAVLAATHASLLAHHAAKIPNVQQGLWAGDTIKVGKTIEFTVLDTPGHTMTHICLLLKGASPMLFSGDTLFNAGCGNCKHGGNPEALFSTFTQQLFKLADNTKIYPGHDYLENNLKFALTREPNNSNVLDLLEEIRSQQSTTPFVSTISLEKEVNPFFRLENPSIIETLRKDFPEITARPSAQEVFLLLRELRNKW